MTGPVGQGHLPAGSGVLLPPRLRPGDRVRLVSPASFPTADWVEETRHNLEDWGLVVDIGRHAMDQWGFMAGRDQDRLADLNDAFRDPGVRAVIAIVGGAGAYRIAPYIDFAAVRADPKPLIGFSDITSLHVALWRNCRLATIHGCLAGADAVRTARQLLMTTEPITVRSEPGALSAGISLPGRAAGPLIGGSLSTVCHAVGTGMPSLRGAILLLEDFRGMGLGRVDRQLTQLINSGTLDGVAGIALGLFSGFDDLVDRSWTIQDVLGDRLGNLGVPVLGGLKIGHGGVGADGGPDQFCVALGVNAELDVEAGTLTVGPGVL